MLRTWHFLNAFKETYTTLKVVNRRKSSNKLSSPWELLPQSNSFFHLWDNYISVLCLLWRRAMQPPQGINRLGWLKLTEKMKLTISKSKQLSKIIFSHHHLTKTLPKVNMDDILPSLGTSRQAWLTHVEQSKTVLPSLVICFSILLMVTTSQQRAETMFQNAWQIIVKNHQFGIYLYCVWLSFFSKMETFGRGTD